MFNRERGWALLHEYTKNPALIRHGQCVEAVMRHYAGLQGENVEQWGLAGLIHDFDYERFPDPPEHTREGAKVLRAAGCDEEVVGAMLSHAPWNLDEYPRDRPIRKTLFAADELSGFIFACSLPRPQRIAGLEPPSVIKKMKQKTFAASVSRDDLNEGARLLEISLDEHITNCIAAIQRIAGDVGLVAAADPGSPSLEEHP